MGFSLRLPVLCFIVIASNFAHAASEDLSIKNAERTVDISSQLVKITHRLTLTNNGKSPVKSFQFLAEASAKKSFSFFKAQVTVLSGLLLRL